MSDTESEITQSKPQHGAARTHATLASRSIAAIESLINQRLEDDGGAVEWRAQDHYDALLSSHPI